MGYLSNSNGSSQPVCSQEALQSKANDIVCKAMDSVSQQLIAPMQAPVLSEIERETLHVTHNYGLEIDDYQRELENDPAFNTVACLGIHKVTPNLRARMIDWMIEVLTNFKCDDQTFFLSVSLIDRYFKLK